MLKKITPSLVLLLFCASVLGQSDTVEYTFINEYRYMYELEYAKNKLSDPDYEYVHLSTISVVVSNMTRIYIKPNVFKEDMLVYRQPYYFKRVGEKWYIKTYNRWYLFYTPNKTLSPIITYLYGSRTEDKDKKWKYQFNFVKYDTVLGHKCLVFRFKPMTKRVGNLIWGKTLSSHLNTLYWFSPELGFIKVGNYTPAIRNDILNKSFLKKLLAREQDDEYISEEDDAPDTKTP